MNLKEIFEEYKTIAVYGMSKHPWKAANSVPVFIMNSGYNVIPINPTVDEIAGMKSYSSLSEIPDEIDMLNVFRPSNDALGIVREAVERKNLKGDIKLIWLQEGIINEEAKQLAEENGINFIQDKCIYREFLEHV